MNYLTEKQYKRFWSKVNIKSPDECWNWTACLKSRGYGRFGLHRKIELAHRVAFISTYGMKDQSNCVLHKCDNPQCVNPTHLFEGTLADNLIDMYKKGRTSYYKGKLNPEAVKVIKWMLKYKPQRGLASKLTHLHKVSVGAIQSIKMNKSWHHIKI